MCKSYTSIVLILRVSEYGMILSTTLISMRLRVSEYECAKSYTSIIPVLRVSEYGMTLSTILISVRLRVSEYGSLHELAVKVCEHVHVQQRRKAHHYVGCPNMYDVQDVRGYTPSRTRCRGS